MSPRIMPQWLSCSLVFIERCKSWDEKDVQTWEVTVFSTYIGRPADGIQKRRFMGAVLPYVCSNPLPIVLCFVRYARPT